MLRTQKLQPQVKSYCEWLFSNYARFKKELAEYERDLIPSAIQDYESSIATSGSGNRARKTEEIMLRIVSDKYIRETERNIVCMENVLSSICPEDRRLIEKCYINQNQQFTPTGVADELHLSKSTAYRRINMVLYLLAVELGLVPLNL